jgi:hypothetical protein
VAAEPAPRPQPAPAAVFFDEDAVFLALRNLPVEEAVKHLAIIGCIGSGKSTLIQLFLQSIAPRFRADRAEPEQLILFDGKCDALPQLAALGLNPEDESQSIYILDPNDERCAVWDLAEATRTPLMARYLATLLVPEERSNAPFFPDSARDLIFAVLLGLGVAGNPKWDFRDLICALDSRERIRAIRSLRCGTPILRPAGVSFQQKRPARCTVVRLYLETVRLNLVRVSATP